MKGLTLTSLMVAVALSGVVTVFGTRLVVDQMATSNMFQLIERGSSIVAYYGSMIRDNEVMKMTLKDPANQNLKEYLRGMGSIVNGESIKLVAPARNVSDQEMIPKGGYRWLGDGMLNPNNTDNGWWRLKIEAKPINRGVVDLILYLCLHEGRYNNHSGRKLNRKYRHLCDQTPPADKILHIRHTDNPINEINCTGNNAVVSVTDRAGSGAIDVRCGQKLLPIPSSTNPPENLQPIAHNRSGRRGVEPKTCATNRAVVGLNNDGTLVCSNESGDGVLMNLPALCGKDGEIDKVVCGITNSGGVTCCSRKGPTGPQGPRGCHPYVARASNGRPRVNLGPTISNAVACRARNFCDSSYNRQHYSECR